MADVAERPIFVGCSPVSNARGVSECAWAAYPDQSMAAHASTLIKISERMAGASGLHRAAQPASLSRRAVISAPQP
ncbi:Hypothetical protein MexAM1_META1p1834 [Methylorubrum extorquens AM1]|uniref:Uncharacterized protein n=1 Tax=Methylorubrum extorquens (strain ATCC 14718 / DSM 1338 / JCM 2805 / NCIMB 9133 / AM1) TaxID=272630 RepID=C5B1P2_METEA|nr:Hypothetical protein MexAM1_META1p1834 [Methylorubrum extorquens AM1]